MDSSGINLKNATFYQKVGVSIITTVIEWALRIASYVGAFIAERIAEAEDKNQDGFQRIARVAIKDMFGVDVALNTGRGGSAGNAASANAIGDAMLRAFAGQARGSSTPGGELQPSDEPAKNFLASMAQLALEGWLEGWMVEAMSLGQLETFGELDDAISHVLGLGRASAAVHGPLVRHLIVTPLEWKVQKSHRPTLLNPSTAIRRFLSDHWSFEQVTEELARQGYSSDRINALIAEATPQLTTQDAFTLGREGHLGREFTIAELRNQGFDKLTADLKLQAMEEQRLAGINDNALAALKRAFVNGDLAEGALDGFLRAILFDDTERAAWMTAAQTERALSVKHLSHAEVMDCVERRILPTAFYRDWLAREGYPQDEAFALELRLRAIIDDQTALEEHRRQLEEERAAKEAARLLAEQQRLAKLEAERLLHRRGSIADLSRAVVRGLITIARLTEVLTPQYDADTVAFLVGLVEADRTAYLEQQQRAEEARQRAARRNVDVGALENAVMVDTLSVQEFRQRLIDLTFTPADADLLTATVRAKKADRDAADAARIQAAALARIKHIDLGRVERLVRRGNATLAQYDSELASLGFDEPSRAAMVELLRVEIADDVEAKRLRDEAAAKRLVVGLSLEQFRRAVLIGSKTDDEFQSYLVKQGYTPEAQLVLVAELRRDVADAEAARLKRAAAEAASAVAKLPLSRVAQAARLGLVTPAAYQARLVAEHFTPADITIDMELLLVEIADTQAARARRDELARKAAEPPALSLATVERAVKAGTATIADYQTAAAGIYEPADVALLVATLDAELAALDDARNRHTTITGELAARTLSLAELEAAVKAGAVSFRGYRAQLVSWGYGPDDADLLTALLLDKLNAAPAGP